MKVYKFYTTTCTPCKMISVMLKDLNLETVDINIDDKLNHDLVQKLNVISVPTLVKVLEDNQEIGRIVGIVSREALKDFFK